MFENINTSASGLTAQRTRMDVISDNIANVNTTRTEDGGPYRRKTPVFRNRASRGAGRFSRILSERASRFSQSGDSSRRGVEIAEIAEDDSPFKTVYNPEHPDADDDGYVEKPNVEITMEMVDMIDASRAYEANINALETAENTAQRALDIGGA